MVNEALRMCGEPGGLRILLLAMRLTSVYQRIKLRL